MSREKLPEQKFVTHERDIQEFIKVRGVKEEDRKMIERLACVDREIVIQCLHNFFSHHREHSSEMLAKEMQQTSDPIRRGLYGIMHEFAEKYDWYTCNHLIAVLEGRAQ